MKESRSYQTSMIDVFCENSYRRKTVIYISKKFSQFLGKVLYIPLLIIFDFEQIFLWYLDLVTVNVLLMP